MIVFIHISFWVHKFGSLKKYEIFSFQWTFHFENYRGMKNSSLYLEFSYVFYNQETLDTRVVDGIFQNIHSVKL